MPGLSKADPRILLSLGYTILIVQMMCVAASDCIVETEHPLTGPETRVWVELPMSDTDVPRETARECADTYDALRRRGPAESVRRIRDVHAEYESTSERT